tara:strand:- start:13760 stop:14035 length:276 start_codon:yes stop_codon:yes gene_type:complete
VVKFQYYSNSVDNPEFQRIAKAALTAKIHGKLQEMNQLLLRHASNYTEEVIFRMAEALGINVPKFKEDYNSNAITRELKKNIRLTQQNKIK